MRRLRRSKGDRALVEGPHLLREAAAAGLVFEELLATPEFLVTGDGRALAAALPIPPVAVDAALLAELADADSPRGIAAVVAVPRGGVAALPRRAGGLYVYADGLQDPGNLGALARVAEAAGAAGLALAAGTAHPNHPRALRGSAGSLFRLPVAVGATPADLDAHLGGRPVWVALAAHGGVDLYATPAAGTLVVALGAEGPGLSAEVAARADLRVSIPLAPPVESLNATVAAALVLFELRRRRGC